MSTTRPSWNVTTSMPGLHSFVAGEELADLVQLLTVPGVDVSSSEIRLRCAQGAPIRYLVPDAVFEYIEREGLYGGNG